MYSVLKKLKDIKGLPPDSLAVEALAKKEIFERLRADIECLNNLYGEERNLVSDLGGYVVILWGQREEVASHYERILKYHNLNAEEYEYEDKMILPERDDITVTFRLFLCSSDYAVEIVSVEVC